MKERPDYLKIASEYCQSVLSGAVPASRWVKLACQRQVNDLKKSQEGRLPYIFDRNAASRVCWFIEHLTHVKGELAGRFIHLEPWQVFILTTVFGWLTEDGRRRYRRSYIEVPRGNGKALACDTLIPTPNGMVRMDELKVGDFVYGSDGEKYPIIAATEVMRGRPCFEIEFNTGDVIIADAEHQWVTDARSDRDRLKGRNGKNSGPKPSIKTTKEISDTLFCRKDRNQRVVVTIPLKGEERHFELEPYLLGVWLGDGSTHTSRITTKDKEIIDFIKGYGYPVKDSSTDSMPYCWSITDGSKGKFANQNSFRKKLDRCGVLHKKHIPEQYLSASLDQRLELLQGLMDTDGFVSKGQGQCEFVQKDKDLAVQVYRLIASLGMRPRILAKTAEIYGKDCGIVYRILFHAYKDLPVFKLPRKVERLRDRPSSRGLQNYRQIVRCDPVQSVSVRCIEVDSPDHCYLAGLGHVITHNSAISSGVALYCLCADKEQGAEVYSFATTRDQAKIVFGDAKQMAAKNPQLRKAFGLQVLANSLYLPNDASTFQAKSAEGSTLDGLNTHCAIIDELHAHKTRAVYDVVETSLGKRLNSLMWIITTAGFDTAGICYEVRTMVREVLEGKVFDDSQFGVIYSIDEDDDWKTEEALKKANPNWGISVRPEVVTSLQKKAIVLPSAMNNFKTKHLDVWCSASSAWMDMQAWDACTDPSLDRVNFEGEDAFIGLDLGSKSDLTAKVLIFPKGAEDGKMHYYIFSDFYLPQRAIETSTNSQYAGWAEEGLIHVSGGAMTDFNEIEESIREDLSRFNVRAVIYDPWQATQLANSLSENDAPMVECRMTVQNLSDPMKSLEALVLDGRLHHDGNPVMNWMMGNVVAMPDHKDNIFPNKDRYENKIDGPVALIMGLGNALMGEENDFAGFVESGEATFFEW